MGENGNSRSNYALSAGSATRTALTRRAGCSSNWTCHCHASVIGNTAAANPIITMSPAEKTLGTAA